MSNIIKRNNKVTILGKSYYFNDVDYEAYIKLNKKFEDPKYIIKLVEMCKFGIHIVGVFIDNSADIIKDTSFVNLIPYKILVPYIICDNLKNYGLYLDGGRARVRGNKAKEFGFVTSQTISFNASKAKYIIESHIVNIKDTKNLKKDCGIKEIIEVTEYYYQDFIIEYIDNNNERQRISDYLDLGFDSKYYFDLLKAFGYKYCHVLRSVPGDEILKFLTYKPLGAKEEDIFLLSQIGPEIFTDSSKTSLKF